MSELGPYLERKAAAIEARRAGWTAAREAGDSAAGVIDVRASSRLAGVTGVRPTMAGVHPVISDSAPGLAGHALGPTAPELLLGALASCLVHTYVIQAILLEVPLDSVEVVVQAQLDMASTLGMHGPPPLLQQITYQAQVASSSSAEAVEWLHAAVEANCPVLNTLRQPAEIRRLPAPASDATAAPGAPAG